MTTEPTKEFLKAVSPASVQAVLDGTVNALVSAFYWDLSPQGFDYWDRICSDEQLTPDAKAFLEKLMQPEPQKTTKTRKSARANNYEVLLATAHKAARDAVQFEAAAHPEDLHALDCGFAWVTIPGRSALAVYCRQRANSANRAYYGSKDYPSGWHFWCPGGFHGQSIRIHEVGAKAFRDALAKAGIVATMQSRLD